MKTFEALILHTNGKETYEKVQAENLNEARQSLMTQFGPRAVKTIKEVPDSN